MELHAFLVLLDDPAEYHAPVDAMLRLEVHHHKHYLGHGVVQRFLDADGTVDLHGLEPIVQLGVDLLILAGCDVESALDQSNLVFCM